MKRRTILWIALVIICVLIGVLLYIPRKINVDTQKEKEKELAGEKNVAEVFNQGENILSYNNYTFIVNTEKNSIIRYSEEENRGRQILHATATIGNQLFVMGNKLIFNVGKNTYYSDLDGRNSAKLIDGNIVYMDDDVYVYILKDTTSEYVCITSYNNANLNRTNDTFSNIAKGNDIKFLRETDKVLFFCSYNTNDTTSLFSLDLNNSKSNVIVSLPTESESERYDFVDIAKVGNVVYPLQATYQISRNQSYLSNTLYYALIDAIVWETYSTDIKPLRIFTDGKRVYAKDYISDTQQYEWIYKEYDEESGVYIEKNIDILNKDSEDYWTNTLYGDLTDLFTLESGKLEMDGLSFATLEEDYKDSTLKYAGLFSDKVYVLVNHNGKGTWFRFNSDGSNLVKIYEYNQ